MSDQAELFDPMCSGCQKPPPREWCWDGRSDCPVGKPPRYTPIAIVTPQQYIEQTPQRRAAEQAHARTSDPITSHEAAASITSDKIRASQEAVLLVLKASGPLHDQALVRRYQSMGGMPEQSESGIRTRRSELVAKGLIEDSGERVVLDSGRRAIVWRAR